MQWQAISGWVAGGLLVLIALFAWWYNSGGDQANNLAKTRNRGISGEAGDSSRDHGGL